MLNAVAAFGGGLWVHNRLSTVSLPTFTRALDEGETFKLSVKVLAASIPSLADPGLVTRERPRVEVVLGAARKETEFGDHKPDNAWSHVKSEGEVSPACPWCFGDTLTFVATREDVLGLGLQVWLRTQSEVRLVFFQMSASRPVDVGVCSVDLRTRILPACAAADGVWESPAMLFPLTHVGGSSNAGDKSYVLGEFTGHVSLSFSVNTDPAALLQAADQATMPLVERVANPLKEWTLRTAGAAANVAQVAASTTQFALQEPVKWVAAVTEAAGCRSVSADPGEANAEYITDSDFCGNCFTGDARSKYRHVGALGPDLSPDGWLSHPGPNGRTFWHHAALGPAPWAQRVPSMDGFLLPVGSHFAMGVPWPPEGALPTPQASQALPSRRRSDDGTPVMASEWHEARGSRAVPLAPAAAPAAATAAASAPSPFGFVSAAGGAASSTAQPAPQPAPQPPPQQQQQQQPQQQPQQPQPPPPQPAAATAPAGATEPFPRAAPAPASRVPQHRQALPHSGGQRAGLAQRPSFQEVVHVVPVAMTGLPARQSFAEGWRPMGGYAPLGSQVFYAAPSMQPQAASFRY